MAWHPEASPWRDTGGGTETGLDWIIGHRAPYRFLPEIYTQNGLLDSAFCTSKFIVEVIV